MMPCRFDMGDWTQITGLKRFSLAAWRSLTGLRKFSVKAWCAYLASLGGGGDAYHADAVHFDGTQVLTCASLTSMDNALCSFSFWVQHAGAISGDSVWTVDPSGGPSSNVTFISGSALRCLLSDTPSSVVLSADTPALGNNTFHHILGTAKTDLAAGNKIIKLYLDDVDVALNVVDSDGSFNIEMNGQEIIVGGDGLYTLRADLSDLWIAPGQSLLTGGDIPEATRRKFISAAGKPVDLGVDGSLPTGIAPAMYFSGDASEFATNKGTGGAFTLTGSLTNAATSPSD